MIAYVLFSLLLGVCLVRFTVIGREAYPFSHYPMFSNLRKLDSAQVFQLVTIDQQGRSCNWSEQYPEEAVSLSRQLQLCLRAPQNMESLAVTLRQKGLQKLQIYRLTLGANSANALKGLVIERELL